MAMEQPNLEQKSTTLEDFEVKHVPTLNTIAELIISHPDIPEETDQGDLLTTLTMVTNELRNTLTDRVPEIAKLKDDINKKNKQVSKLQETNQQLYLRVGAPPDPNKKLDEEDRPKKSFDEIRAMIDKL